MLIETHICSQSSPTQSPLMEVSPLLVTTIVLSAVVLVSIVRWAWGMLNWVWLRPKTVEKCFRRQGIAGNSYKLLYGDTKESSLLQNQALSKPMTNFTHDIAPRVLPFLHQSVTTYGKICFMWLGPEPQVIITNPDDLRDVLTKHDDFQKPDHNPIIKLLATGLAHLNGEKWVKHRRLLNPAFHLEKLKSMVPAFYQSCNEMIEEWESLVSKEGSSELDAWPYLENMTADVISRTAFGSSYQEGRKLFQLLKEQLRVTMKVLQQVYIPGWRFLPTKLNKRMKELNEEIRGLLRDMINKREEAINAGEATPDDLLGIMMESNLREIREHDKNVGMSIEDVIDECKLFYFAGQETTSILLVWTMILLSQHQDWQARAREEVLQVFGTNKPDFDGLTHLRVVTMILHEVIRLYPPVTNFHRKPHKKTQLGKVSVPAGVHVGLPTLLVHHDKQLWGEDANEFKPERFSEGVSKATKNKCIYFPFGGGARICIGQNFAMVEAKMAMSLILQHFSFELSPAYTHAPAAILTLQPQHGAHIILHKR